MSADSPAAKALNCPKCGAPLTVRSFDHAVTIVCGSCGSILDAKDPALKILQEFEAKTRAVEPLIPLGTRGTMPDGPYEVIGLQQRTITVEGADYSWHEYLLFNPFKGFRYLTQYDGHWNDARPLRSLPAAVPGTRQRVSLDGVTYKHFQTAEARTTFVLGEFPWEVRVGEIALVSDYVAPPRLLSREATGNEATWSIGEYIPGRIVWEAFGLPGQPPRPVGVYANQPSPFRSLATTWRSFAVMAAVGLVLMIGMALSSLNAKVFERTYTFDARPQQAEREPSFVTDVFELKGHTSNVELTTRASVDNSWLVVNYALINQDTGQAYDFGREVSWYHGRDEDGDWSEGSSQDVAIIPSVPPGRYYLRVEPDTAPDRGAVRYNILVKRDVPRFLFYGVALLALAIPPAVATWRSLKFEHARWAEGGGAAPDIGSAA